MRVHLSFQEPAARFWTALVVFLPLWGLPGLADAAGQTASGGAGTSAQTAPWQPPPPPPDDFDWIQLKSGEWLKGHIKSMQKRKLEFNSEELDDLTFNWEDIKFVRAPRAYCQFEDRTTAAGMLEVNKDYVQVTGQETNRFPRGTVLGISPGLPKERNYWSGKLSVGGSVRSGNTEQSEVTASAKVHRRTPATSIYFDYLGNFGRLEGVENVNNHRARTFYDIFLSRRFFLRPLHSEYYRDPFQNIAHRGTLGLGAGYYLFDRPRLEWLVSGGPAYQRTRFFTADIGQKLHESTPAFVFESRFDMELTKRVDLLLSYQGIITSRDAGFWTHHNVNTLEIELTKLLDLDVSLVWDRTENPKAGANGLLPKQNDFRLTLSLGLDF